MIRSHYEHKVRLENGTKKRKRFYRSGSTRGKGERVAIMFIIGADGKLSAPTYVFNSLSVSLSVCLSLSLSLSVCLSLSLLHTHTICICLSLSLYLSWYDSGDVAFMQRGDASDFRR